MTMALNTKVLKALCEGYTLLYVEDDALVRDEVERTLKRLFQEVYIAKDGVEGLEAFCTYHPHVVITDIGMPRKNGLVMSKEIEAPYRLLLLSPQHLMMSVILCRLLKRESMHFC